MEQPNNDPESDPPREAESHTTPPLRPEVRYERTDISFRAVLIGAVVGCVVAAGIFFVVRALFWTALDSIAAGQGRPSSALEKSSTKLPPEPRLEQLDRTIGTRASNVTTWELGKEKRLESYGPTDDKGFVHIPLERAMDLLAGHLPIRKDAHGQPKAGVVAKDRGLVDAGESNSGRMFRRVEETTGGDRE